MAGQKPIARALAVIAAHSDVCVVVGGWAHELHRRHPWATPPDHPSLLTVDLDVACRRQDALHDLDLASSLCARDFLRIPSGESRPPSERFEAVEDRSFYVQFLVPRKGSGEGRRRSGATAEVAGIVADAVPFGDLLLDEPWTLSLPPEDPLVQAGFSGPVRVCNAASFMAQKLLILERRSPSKADKDLVYIHDTVQLFAASLGELGSLWRAVSKSLPAGSKRRLRDSILSLEGPGRLLSAWRILDSLGRSQTPSGLGAALREGLQKVFLP